MVQAIAILREQPIAAKKLRQRDSAETAAGLPEEFATREG